MIETYFAELPHGIRLHCRVAGPKGAPALMFLHGFPEAAFVWDEMLEHFGSRFRCIAPNLRGFEQSSAPPEVKAYRVKHLMADLMALIEQQVGGPLDALIAHDWGGAVAWNLAAQHPEVMKRLVIINSPHPATFLRELQTNPAQQAASAYMNFLCRPDAEALLSENDFARMWPLLEGMGATDPNHPGGGWLTEAVKAQYRAVWRAGLTGALNYYRASPLRPPTAPDSPVMALSFPPEFVTVKLPTHVVWAEADRALPASLLDGLEAFVPRMTLTRVPQATHWIVHERPELIAHEIESALAG
ncbi:MAG: alpha/beta fold hydrolase [Cytophagales bacterium]|nr:alpha/beta fold hydrolase [Rhizobacter sp.]